MSEGGRRRGSAPGAVVELLVASARRFWHCDAPRQSAALAYYALFAVVPMAVVVTYLVGAVLGPEVARGGLAERVELLLPGEAALALSDILGHAGEDARSGLVLAIGLAVSLFGATSAFAAARDGLDSLLDVPPGTGSPIVAMLRERLLALVLVLAIGLLALVALALDGLLTVVVDHVASQLGGSDALQAAAAVSALVRQIAPGVPQLAEVAVDWVRLGGTLYSLLAVLVLTAAMLRFLPDRKLSWPSVLVGAAVTTVLFAVARAVFTLYLTRLASLSFYGAAGATVGLLLWAYYGAQGFYFGAAVACSLDELRAA